jgi:translation initiation factor IF-3
LYITNSFLTKTLILAKGTYYRRKRNFTRAPREPEHKINERIRVDEVRLVGDNMDEISKVVGKKIEAGVYPTIAVRQWAEEIGKDLVMIAPKAVPPVCRIIEYNKFLYQKKKKEKEIRSKAVKTVIKEIRFGPNTDDHDFEFKVRHAKKFLEEGAKVKAYVHFRGRTIVFKDRGELLLLRFLKELEEHGAAEALPKMEGRRMTVIISPKK